MSNYTVLVLYPERGLDAATSRYLAHVQAKGPKGAAKRATMECWEVCSVDEETAAGPAELLVMFVCRGHKRDLTPGDR
jgi:hypothetical protein